MAYQPTLADIPEDTYVPTAGDIPTTPVTAGFEPAKTQFAPGFEPSDQYTAPSVTAAPTGLDRMFAQAGLLGATAAAPPTLHDVSVRSRGLLQSLLEPLERIYDLPGRAVSALTGEQFTPTQIQLLSPEEEQDPQARLGKAYGAMATGLIPGVGEEALVARGVPRLAAAPAAWGGFGAIEDPTHPLRAAAESIAGRAAPEVLPLGWKAGKGLYQYLTEPMIRKGIPKKLSDMLNYLTDFTNNSAYNTVENNYENAVKQNNSRWDQLTPMANQLSEMGVGFDRRAYLDALHDASTDESLEGRGLNTPEEKAQAKSILNDEINKARTQMTIAGPRSNMEDLNNAMAKRKEVNKKSKKFFREDGTIRPDAEKKAYDAVRDAVRDSVKSTVDKNAERFPLAQQFGDLYDSANKEHQNIINTYEKTATQKQKLTPTIFRNIYGNPQNADTSAFVNDFLPSPKITGTKKFEQLSDMLKNPEHAKNLIKSNYFRDSIQDDQVLPNKFLAKYRRLSNEQKQYLFGDKDKALLDFMNKESLKPKTTKTVGVILKNFRDIIPMILTRGADLPLGGELGARLIERRAMAPTQQVRESNIPLKQSLAATLQPYLYSQQQGGQ